MEGSMYIIQPEAMIYREKIRMIIANWQLKIIVTKHPVLPAWALKELYPNLSDDDLLGAISTRFREPVEAALVYGEKAIKKLIAASGRKTEPAACNPESIRFLFGTHAPIIIGDKKYYQNAIHRPKDKTEAEKNIALFWKL